MAKRKDSVALFEVITATRKRQEAATATGTTAPSLLRTPKWWFKAKDKQLAAAQGDPAPAAAVATASPAFGAPQLTAPADASTTSSGAAPPAVVQRVAVAPERVTIPSERPGEGDPFGLDFPEQRTERPRRTWLGRFGGGGGGSKVGLDPDRREVTLRFRYTTAIIVGFAICVAVGLAYVTGRQTNKASAGPNPVSSAAIKNGPVFADVLKIGAGEARPDEVEVPPDAQPQPPKQSDGPARGRLQPPAPPPATRVGTNPAMPGPADGVETALPRIKGLNYVIVQSYPDLKSATEAQKALEAEGIPCTVESGPADWVANPEWRSVVGIHGFARLKDVPAYRRYVGAIEAVSKKFAGNSKFKKFEPMAYKWK